MKKFIIDSGFSFLVVISLMMGCTKSNNYEEIPLEYAGCPCEQRNSFIRKNSLKDVFLFDAAKTSMSEMRDLSLKDNASIFVSYSAKSDTAILYSYTLVSNIMNISIGYICNFPQTAKDWTIPLNGELISFSADSFVACYASPSAGFTQTYSDNILTSFKRKVK
jgi:hypothetical protein